MKKEDEEIKVWGARVHNLKNVDVTIPRNSLTVITGLSGSGKSSLAFGTIYAEGQRRYIETFSAYARNFLGNIERPDVDKITRQQEEGGHEEIVDAILDRGIKVAEMDYMYQYHQQYEQAALVVYGVIWSFFHHSLKDLNPLQSYE